MTRLTAKAVVRELLLWGLILTVMVLCVAGLVSSGVSRPREDFPRDVVTIDSAQECELGFSVATVPDNCAWKETNLPTEFRGLKDWHRASINATADSWFRTSFTLERVPDDGIAVFNTNFNRSGTLIINSAKLPPMGAMDDPLPLSWNRAHIFVVPAALLRVGNNILEVQVRHYVWERGALSKIRIGPLDVLQPLFERRAFWQNEAVEFMSAVSATIGCFVLGLWLLRRSEASYFWFGCMCLAWTICNFDYFMPNSPVPPHAWEDVVLQMIVLRAVLLVIFILRYCNRRMPGVEAALWIYFAAGAIAVATDTIQGSLIATFWLLGPLIWTPFIAILMMREGIKRHFWDGIFVFAAAMTYATLSWHDAWIYSGVQKGYLFLAPYSTLLFVVAVGLSLIRHFVASLTGYELQHRVAVRSLDEARKATKEKNLFFSMVSHELKSPLQSIVTVLATEEVRSQGRERRESLQKIRRAVRKMERQIRDLYVFSTADEAKLEMRSETFEVGDLIDAIAASASDLATSKGLQLEVVRKAEPLFVATDPKRVEQILWNLVENAIKYTLTGSVRISYSLKSTTILAVSVADTGAGIPREHIEKIFTPYRRFGLLEREHNSLGIGLAVVQTLVTHLGGECQVDSSPGQGSTFTVLVPVAVEHAAPADFDEDRAVRMLIVDDRPEMLNDLREVAEALGYHVACASSAPQASNQLAVTEFDLVLIDLDMPVKNGYELASEIRRGDGPNSGAPLVAISAGSLRVGEEVADGLWPFDGFEQKPIDARAMRRVVEVRARRS